ncbi:hypothetical protein [Lentzea sp. HUAS12]|uniref:hypothetical protein n=1 Tax=Lentzea sp. HUAS12 TaxID=2951806 RepID=UPI00209CD3EF|nr:hypothetical protein [Lentzea sp. HUAS12]USX53765.1 hypothetical protein ND450_06580 [Lentzea sp. HUAS12]
MVIARERRGRLPDDVAGSTPTEAGVLLAVTGLISVPGALVVPLLVARLRNVGRLIAVGVAQGIAYALGPLLVGLLRDVSGGWTLPLLFLLAVILVTAIPVVTLAKPAFVEDELAR